MHLYIRSSTFSTEIPDIRLLDGHIPQIGTLTPEPDSEDDVFPTMEPAVWFKVLVMDSVSIDCTKRAIHWNSLILNMLVDSVPPATADGELRRERRKRISESMYVGGECFGYHNDLDELFDSAHHLIDMYASSKISCNAFHKELFALLHCYVLPSIKLNTDDVAELVQALHQQGEEIRKCDEEILAKYAKLDEIAKSMKRQRQMTYIPELTQSPQKNASYPPELVKCLQRDIDEDVRGEWAKIESQNEGIQSLKAESDPDSSSSSGSEKADNKDNELELSLKRQERDALLKNYEQMISARESLHAMANGGSVVAHPPPGRWARKKKTFRHKKGSTPPNPLHNIYIELHNRFKQMEDEIRHATLKKVRIISVKEAINATIKELKDNDESYGVDFDQTGSQRPTDVMRQSRIPHFWQTLTEKVASCINKGGSITKQFHEFQAQILTQCQGLLDEHENLLKSVPLQSTVKEKDHGVNAVFCEPKDHTSIDMGASCFTLPRGRPTAMYQEDLASLGSLTAAEDDSSRQSSDFLFVFNKERDYLKRGVESIRKEIHKHFQLMIERFLTKLKMTKTPANERKIWLCYESYFYEAVMPALVKVYDKAYAATMLSLQDIMPTLTVDDLAIEDTFLIHLLAPCEAVSQEASHRFTALSSDSSGTASPAKQSKQTDSRDEEQTVPRDLYRGARIHEPVHSPAELEAYIAGESGQDVRRQQVNEEISEARQKSDRLSEETQDTSSGFRSSEDFQEKVGSSGCLSCEEVRERSNSSDILSCDDVREKHKSSDTDSCVGSDHAVFQPKLEFYGNGDSCEDLDVRPRLEMLPSMVTLSDTSSLSSDSNGDLRTSDINLKLLQEAEDIVAGLKKVDVKEEESPLPIRSRVYQRAASTPDRDTTIPKALEAGENNSSIVRHIKVHHPTSVTVVYHRCTWPIPHAASSYKQVDASVDSAEDALNLDKSPAKKAKASPAQLLCYSIAKFRPEIAHRFQDTFRCLSSVITETAPLLKLQSLTTCLRSLNQQLSALQQDLGKTVQGASTDDLIDLLVLLLCNYDPVLACRLYPQITLLSDVMAPFFEGGPYSFSLVQFSVAFQFLQDKIVLKQSIAENARGRRDLESTA